MNLFEISGKITLDSNGAISSLSSVTSAAKGAANILGTLGSAALKMGGVVAGGVATAGGAIVKEAVSSYAAAEQLVGGIETLFGDSAGQVQQYAGEAFRAAGLSSNEYMETAMGFSASLKQSLGGDTAAMAEYANMAIVDMSDNANKMGTDMGAIQNAYQGFAKQNYTMLDNLKLGYGGTKTEMERLIKDANKVKKANGEMADLSINSFADVVEAIHIMQTEMGITGTTASEASDTISGSAASAKAAWKNLMTGVADENADMDKLVSDFVSSGKVAAENLLPRIGTAIGGTMQLAQQLVPQMIEEFQIALPDLKAGAYELITEGLNFAGIDVDLSSVTNAFETAFSGASGVGATLMDSLGTIKNTIVGNLGNLGGVLKENGIGIEDFFNGLNTTISVVAEPLNAGIDAAMKGLTALTDWATTDGSTLNTVLKELGEETVNASAGLTGFFESAGYLFEGDTTKAGSTFRDTLNQTATGTILTTIWDSFVNPESVQTTDHEFLNPFDIDRMADILTPKVTPTVDDSWMLELEAMGDAAQAGMVYTFAEPIPGPSVTTTGIEDVETESEESSESAAEALKSAFEFDLATPPVDTGSFTEAVEAADAAAAAIQESFAGLTLAIPAVSAGGAAVPGTENYASGGIMTSPTIFGFNPYTNNLMRGGEAGPEAIAPISTLQSYIGEAVHAQSYEQAAAFDRMFVMMESLVDSLPNAMRDAMEGMAFKTNGREFGRMVKGARA